MSSEFDLNENIKYANKIVYDYDKIQIFKSAINSPDRNVPLNTEFVNTKRGEPNISYTDENSISDNRYDSIKIHVYKLIHNNINSITIDDTSIIGELVIEHTNNSDPNDKHYICFLLKHIQSGSDNEVDILLNFKNQDKSSAYIELNKVIPQQDNCIIYTSTPVNGPEYPNTVYVFTTPIEIHGTTSKDIINKCPISTSLFNDTYKSEYMVLPSNNISKRGEEEIYIDCSPTGESQETIDTYNIPINSQLTSNLEEADHMKTVIDFATFAVYSLVIAIILPPLYKATAIKSALMYVVSPNGIRLRSIDSIICFSMIVTIIVLIATGYNTIGLILLFTTVLGGLQLYTYKQNPDFIKISGKEIKYDPDKKFDINDIGNSVIDLFKSVYNIIIDEKKEGWGKAFLIGTIIIFILLIVLTIRGDIYWTQLVYIAPSGAIIISLILALIRILSIPLNPTEPKNE